MAPPKDEESHARGRIRQDDEEGRVSVELLVPAVQPRQERLDRVDDLDRVGVGLPLDVHDDRGRARDVRAVAGARDYDEAAVEWLTIAAGAGQDHMETAAARAKAVK